MPQMLPVAGLLAAGLRTKAGQTLLQRQLVLVLILEQH